MPKNEPFTLTIEIAQAYLEWYSYHHLYFDSEMNGKLYFRMNSPMKQNYVLAVFQVGDHLVIHQAKEDFYEKYPLDFYDMEFETSNSIEEVLEELSKR